MMVQPLNYSINLPQQAMTGAISGVQNALQIAQGMESAEAEKARGALFRAQTAGAELDVAAKQRAAEQAAVLQQEIQALAKRPTAEGINGLILKHPHLSEPYNRVIANMTAEQREASVREAYQVYAAVAQGKTDIALDLLRNNAAAYRERGDDKRAKSSEDMARLIEASPEGALIGTGGFLAVAMGDKFPEAMKAIDETRRARMSEGDVARQKTAEADRAVSEAASAAVKAKYAESAAALDLQKQGWDITKMQADTELSKANTRLANMRAQLEKDLAPLQRKELEAKIAQAERDRDQKTRERVAEAASQYQVVNDAKSLIKDLLSEDNRPALNGATGMSSFLGAIPGTPEKDIAVKIERLKTLVTADNLKLMTGVLTKSDIDFLTQLGASLDRSIRSKTFISELKRVDNMLVSASNKLETRYGPEPKAPSPGKTEDDW